MHNSEQQVAIACAVRSVAQAFARLADVLDPAVSHVEGTTTSGLEELRAQLAGDRRPTDPADYRVAASKADARDLQTWAADPRGLGYGVPRDLGSRYLCGITEARPVYFSSREEYRDHVLTVHPDWPGAEALRAEQPQLEQQDRNTFTPSTNRPTVRHETPTLQQPCGCSPWTICDTHAATRAKGCTCHGPCFSSECPNPTHRAQAADTPDLDPSRVG